MDENSLDSIERQLAAIPQSNKATELRTPVLVAVRRELAAQRWDRRLVRFAAALLVIGIGMNWTVSWQGAKNASGQMDLAAKSASIVETAVVVAQASDAETGCIFARHLAALSGTALTDNQAAAIEQAIKRHLQNVGALRNEG